eukprot:5028600-Prorocentrum_lima.AAC.1
MLVDKTQTLVWLLNDGKGEWQDALSDLLTDTKGHSKKNTVKLNHDKEIHAVGRVQHNDI